MRTVYLSLVACSLAWLVVPAFAQETLQQHAEAEKASSQREQHHHATENRLAQESSPYLLQHAHNPVDWYPWGEEAFAKAKREGKLVFLSVGYAACHWCHVMERESFVDPEIANAMNEKFVCVKVDREERPDVDQIYMTAVQMLSGNGGWPMSVFLLPDGRPFWGGTYFPARDGDRGNAVGFQTVMTQIEKAWKEQPEAVEKQAAALTEAIKANQTPQAEKDDDNQLDNQLIESVSQSLQEQFDTNHGGFGRNPNQPKFPEPSNLIFLLDRSRRRSVPDQARDSAGKMFRQTLDGMLSGAMYDHLGGGFHRYSVDGMWQIPHFEKMLYDNGQLASLYAEAYADTKNPEYRHVAQGICDFVLRELRAEGGAFYSALDADSEGEEGKFYRWTSEQLEEFGSIDGFKTMEATFRLSQPNFEEEFIAPAPGKALNAIAEEREQTFSQLMDELQPTRDAMLAARNRRVRPLTDVKILTAWNGLMIAGLADSGRILQRNDYTDAAAKAADFLLGTLRTEDGRLRRSYAKNSAKLNAYADDYAFLVSGLLALHRATGEQRWLTEAQSLTEKQIEFFWDEQHGGFFFTSNDHPTLIVRVKDPVDSALPAAMSVSVENLLAISELTENKEYLRYAQRCLQSLAPLTRRAPAATPRAAAALAAFLDSRESTAGK